MVQFEVFYVLFRKDKKWDTLLMTQKPPDAETALALTVNG